MEKCVSFPGLGIGPIKIDPVAFSIFGFDIVWYGVLIACGMILAYFNASYRAKQEGVKSDDIIDLALFVILFGVLGARLYYVIFNLEDYIVSGKGFFANIGGTFMNIINIRQGGLAIYGGVICGAVAGFFVARYKRIRFPLILDILASSVIIGQIIGRWGNFMNMEAYGAETDLPWRMGLLQLIPGSDTVISETYVHPTFLYESLWNLVGFILIACFYKKKKYHGQVALWYLSWYGFGRMFIEGLRQDSLYLGNMRVSQFLAALMFAVCSVLLIIFGRKFSPRNNAKYKKQFTVLSEEAVNDTDFKESVSHQAEVSLDENEISDNNSSSEDSINGKDN